MVAQLDKHYIQIRPTKAVSRLISYALFEGRPLTTKGAWINPIVFAHFRIEKHLPKFRKIRKPIFIIGTGRSGTTMLGVLLSIHPDIGFLNEPKALWYSAFKYEDVIGSYSKGAARYRLFAQDATEKIKRNVWRLFGAYLAVIQAKRLLDKYPELTFRVPFVKAIFPDAKFIFLVRNGWDTCSSIESWSNRKGAKVGNEVHDWWGVDNRKWRLMVKELVENDSCLSEAVSGIRELSRHTDMAAVEWIITMREGLRQLERYPADIYMLRYEDLVENPEPELSRLLEFCELAKDAKLLKYAKKILKRRPPHLSFEMNREILPLFKKTMQDLGYSNKC